MLDFENKKYRTRSGLEYKFYAECEGMLHGVIKREGGWFLTEHTGDGQYQEGRTHDFDLVEVVPYEHICVRGVDMIRIFVVDHVISNDLSFGQKEFPVCVVMYKGERPVFVSSFFRDVSEARKFYVGTELEQAISGITAESFDEFLASIDLRGTN